MLTQVLFLGEVVIAKRVCVRIRIGTTNLVHSYSVHTTSCCVSKEYTHVYNIYTHAVPIYVGSRQITARGRKITVNSCFIIPFILSSFFFFPLLAAVSGVDDDDKSKFPGLRSSINDYTSNIYATARQKPVADGRRRPANDRLRTAAAAAADHRKWLLFSARKESARELVLYAVSATCSRENVGHEIPRTGEKRCRTRWEIRLTRVRASIVRTHSVCTVYAMVGWCYCLGQNRPHDYLHLQ